MVINLSDVLQAFRASLGLSSSGAWCSHHDQRYYDAPFALDCRELTLTEGELSLLDGIVAEIRHGVTAGERAGVKWAVTSTSKYMGVEEVIVTAA